MIDRLTNNTNPPAPPPTKQAPSMPILRRLDPADLTKDQFVIAIPHFNFNFIYIYENRQLSTDETISITGQAGQPSQHATRRRDTRHCTINMSRQQARAYIIMSHGSHLSRLTHQGTEIRERASQGAARLRRRRLRRRRPLAKAPLAHVLSEAGGGLGCRALLPCAAF